MKYEDLDLLQRGVIMKTSQSQKEIPAVSYTYKADVTKLYQLYKQKNVTLNPIFLRIIAEGVKCAPLLNSTIQLCNKQLNGKIIIHSQVNIDVPWLLKNGKIVPLTFFNVQDKKISELAKQTQLYKQEILNTDFDDLYQEMLSNNRKEIPRNWIQPDSIGEGNITVTNIGSICHFPGELTQAMIIPPQVATIAIGYAEDQLKVLSGEIHIAKELPINITFDHRAMNFNDLIPFIAKLDEILKNPSNFFTNNY